MKKGIKKQLLTGIAAAALVAPMILGGLSNNVHAASAPQALTSAQPSASAQSNANAQGNGQNAQNGKPKKTITMQQFKQILAKQAAKQKQQMAKQMKGATTVFMAKGNEIYTIKAKGRQAFPTTMKKYMSVRRFEKVTKPKRMQLQRAIVRYRATHAKKYLRQIQNNIKYVRIAQMPNTKQQAQNAKQTKSNQQAQTKVRRHGKSTKKVNKRARKRTHKARHRAKRTRISKRIKRSHRRVRKSHKKRTRRAATAFTVKDHGKKETLLKSEFKRGSQKQAKRTRFAKGPTLDGVKTFFDRYMPNNRRAVIPKRYKIYPDNTTWLVGRHTNNVGRINHMKNAYYYNNKFRGWFNVGYKNNQN